MLRYSPAALAACCRSESLNPQLLRCGTSLPEVTVESWAIRWVSWQLFHFLLCMFQCWPFEHLQALQLEVPRLELSVPSRLILRLRSCLGRAEHHGSAAPSVETTRLGPTFSCPCLVVLSESRLCHSGEFPTLGLQHRVPRQCHYRHTTVTTCQFTVRRPSRFLLRHLFVLPNMVAAWGPA